MNGSLAVKKSMIEKDKVKMNVKKNISNITF